MKVKSYIIIDFLNAIDQNFLAFNAAEDFFCLGYYTTYDSAFNAILEKKPQLLFFHFKDKYSLNFLLELKQYLIHLPYIIGINAHKENAFHAIKYGINDYMLFPLEKNEIRNVFLKLENLEQKQLTKKLCVRSNGDYHFLPLSDILYLKADNNTTDFYLQNGKIITGFKTMKHYENQLPVEFFRIHNSYIVNILYVSRINLSKSFCCLLDHSFKIPFSRTYKTQIDAIIKQIN